MAMFATHSPYSPFFTSGLLSAGSRPHSPDVPLSPRRGSLPTSRADDVPAFYFTLHHEDAYRSFLSLDLAESQSMRSASLKRKANTPYRFPYVALCVYPPPADIPQDAYPKLLPRQPCACASPATRCAQSRRPSPRRPSHSPLCPRSPARPRVCPPSSSRPPSISASQRAQFPRLCASTLPLAAPSVHTTSTVSTRARVSNRSAALARLEGRYRRPNTAPLPKRNFMSMSDDEDDEDAASDSDSRRRRRRRRPLRP